MDEIRDSVETTYDKPMLEVKKTETSENVYELNIKTKKRQQASSLPNEPDPQENFRQYHNKIKMKRASANPLSPTQFQ